MGNSKSTKERLNLLEEDFSTLEAETLAIREIILKIFPCDPIQTDSWPFRYLFKQETNQYEFIFSQMGSVTVRIAVNELYRRNPPPIFYISLGKYKEGFIWENFNAEEIDTTPSELKRQILNKIEIANNA